MHRSSSFVYVGVELPPTRDSRPYFLQVNDHENAWVNDRENPHSKNANASRWHSLMIQGLNNEEVDRLREAFYPISTQLTADFAESSHC